MTRPTLQMNKMLRALDLKESEIFKYFLISAYGRKAKFMSLRARTQDLNASVSCWCLSDSGDGEQSQKRELEEILVEGEMDFRAIILAATQWSGLLEGPGLCFDTPEGVSSLENFRTKVQSVLCQANKQKDFKVLRQN